MPIIDVTKLKLHLGIPAGSTGRDDRLTTVAAGIDAHVTKITGRTFEAGAPIVDEAHASNGGDAVVLDKYPASALVAVSVDGVVLDVSDDKTVTLDPSGILYRTDGEYWPDTKNRKSILVSYTGGIAAPDDLVLAALELAAHVYRKVGGVESQSSGGVSQSLISESLDELPHVQPILEQHRDHSRGFRL